MKFQFYHSQVINTCLLRHWLLMQLPFIRGHPHVSAWMCCCSETQEHGSSLHGAWINFVIHKMVQHWVLLSYRVVLGISAMSTQTYHWWESAATWLIRNQLYSLNKCQYSLWRLRWWWCHDHKGFPQQYQLPQHLTMKENWAETPERCLHHRNIVVYPICFFHFLYNHLKTSQWYKFLKLFVPWSDIQTHLEYDDVYNV